MERGFPHNPDDPALALRLPCQGQAQTHMSRFVVLLLVVFVASATAAPGFMPCADAPMTSHCCCEPGTPAISADAGANCCVARAPEVTGTAAVPRTDVTPPLAASPIIATGVFAVARAPRTIPIHTSPPRSLLVDLPTLFSTFLI